MTGSPSSKNEQPRASALLRNIRNIRICMGKKPIVSYENERISIKKKLTLHKMSYVSPVWPMDRFMAVLSIGSFECLIFKVLCTRHS